MPRKGKLTISLNRKRCPWLPYGKYIPKGKEVFEFDIICAEEGMVAVTDRPGQYPFYEVPADAVKWDAAT